MLKNTLLDVLGSSGQEHVLDAFDTLKPDEQEELAAQINSGINFNLLNIALKEGLAALDSNNAMVASVKPPPSDALFCATDVTSGEVAQLEAMGLALIASGRAAVLLLAGGSGTRLGVTIPKGLFKCDDLRQSKSLFQFHCERVLRAQELALEATPAALDMPPPGSRDHRASSSGSGAATRDGKVQLLVMTSDENDTATRVFFMENNYFGLDAAQVHFFQQTSLPCYDEAMGRILMASPHRMCMAPGGNGGVYQSLAGRRASAAGGESSSMLDMLRQHMVEHVQIFSVDNILARVADPLFFGYAIHSHASVTVKTTPKVSADERVGVFALKDGQWGVVEYTEIGSTLAAERDTATGALRFNCANIASHSCTVDFLVDAAKRMETETLYHAARKSVKTKDGVVMGVKLEAFIFDMFRHCRSSGDDDGDFRIMQVNRAEEFAPIKNAEGAASDTATTAAQLLLSLHTWWAMQLLERSADEHSPIVEEALRLLHTGIRRVEVSPLVSFSGEGLEPYALVLAEQIVRSEHAVVLLEKPR